MRGFVHLQVKTNYSIGSSIAAPSDLARKAAEQGAEALAIADSGTLRGAFDLRYYARKSQLKPIFGLEVLLEDTSAPAPAQRGAVLLLARNNAGLQNLGILARREERVKASQPTSVAVDELHGLSSGLFCINCPGRGPISAALLADDLLGATRWLETLARMFNHEAFLLGERPVDRTSGAERRPALESAYRTLGDQMGVPFVAVNDVRFVDQADAEACRLLTQWESVRPNGADSAGLVDDQQYLKTRDQMSSLFPKHARALDATVEVARLCNVDLETRHGIGYRPSKATPSDTRLALGRRCLAGARCRYGEPSESVLERLREEIEVADSLGMAQALLAWGSLLDGLRSEGVLFGPGRGTAADSLIAYVLGASDIDPIEFGLPYGRFMHADYPGVPSLTIDVETGHQESVIETIREHLGSDRTEVEVHYRALSLQDALRRAHQLLNQSPEILELAIERIALNERVWTSPYSARDAFKKIAEMGPSFRRLTDVASRLAGLPFDRVLSDTVGITTVMTEPDVAPRRATWPFILASSWGWQEMREAGCVNFDLIDLECLAQATRTIRLVSERHGVTVQFDQIPVLDSLTRGLVDSGETRGVFLLGSERVRDALRRAQPGSLQEFANVLALCHKYKAEDTRDEYLVRTRSRAPISMIDPILGDLLEPTYGMLLYQEQLLRIANEILGLPLHIADDTRRAIGKRDREKLERLRESWSEAGSRKAIDAKSLERIWRAVSAYGLDLQMQGHYLAHALLSIRLLHLKAHWPVEWRDAKSELRGQDTLWELEA